MKTFELRLQTLSVSEFSTLAQLVEVFMKLMTVLTALFFIQGAFANTEFEMRKRSEMIERSNSMIDKIETARSHLKKVEVKEACDIIQELLKIYPDHLKSIGMHMDNSRSRVIVMRDEVLDQLIFIHRQSVVCERGENAEHVDTAELGKELKKMEKILRKQKRVIKKEDTGFANDFYYHYEF